MNLQLAMQQAVRLFAILFLSTQFIACEAIHDAIHGDGGGGNAALDNDSLLTDNFQVVLADGLVPVELEGDVQGAFIFAGPDENVRAIGDLAEKELAGFIQQIEGIGGDSLYESQTADQVLDDIIQAINLGNQSALAISRTAPNSAFASGAFSLTTNEDTNNIDLAQLIALLITPDLPANSTIAQFAAEQAAELLTSDFRLSVSVALDSAEVVSDETPAEGEEPITVTKVFAIIIFTIVNESLFDNYSERTTNIIDESNIIDPDDTTTERTQNFTAEAQTSLLSDFLFVIDNSSSMGGEQAALVDAADAFITEIQSSGLDYEIGIITTDNTNLIDDQTDRQTNGDFFSDLDVLRAQIAAVGTRGSTTERGIYMSELALSPVDALSPFQGTVTERGHPRADASLSVIIMSDEESQYPSNTFDVADNLFVDNGYRVYSIVDVDDNDYSQYDELSNATGGAIADIENVDSFPAIMQAIASDAGGSTSPYVLEFTPIASTIEVYVDGVLIENGPNGWQYFAGSNTIFLRGSAIPAAGASIQVTYVSVKSAQ